MNKTILRLLTILLACLILTGTSLGEAYTSPAETGELILAVNQNGALLYDSPDLESARPIAVIPRGKSALRIADIDWGWCVTFGNYAGYVREEDGMPVPSGYFEYEMPWGTDYSYSEDDLDYSYDNDMSIVSEVPEFPFQPIGCEPTQDQIATRSGPNTAYTWEGNHSPRLLYRVLYQTEGNGINWGCIEFEKYDVKYRLYTGMWRLEPVSDVPYTEEEAVWAHITREHTPSYGPGYDYAECSAWTMTGAVKAFYQQYGWLMYECTMEDGSIQRCWAPPGCWE